MATLCCHVLCVDVIALTQREVASAVSLSSYLLIMVMILSIETGHIQAIMDFFTASVRSWFTSVWVLITLLMMCYIALNALIHTSIKMQISKYVPLATTVCHWPSKKRCCLWATKKSWMHDISLPGASTADLGGPELARLGQTVQDLMREKSRALGPSYGKGDKTLGPEMAGMRRTNILGATAPEAHAGIGFRPAVLTPGREVKSLDSKLKSSSLGRMTPFDKNSESLAVSQGEVGENYDSLVSLKRGTASHGATPVTGGVRQQLPLEDNIRGLGHVPSQVQRAQDYDLSSQQNQWVKNCGSTRGLSDALGINRHEHLGPETQRGQGLVPQPHAGKDSKQLGHASPQTLPQTQDVRGNIFSPPQGQAARNYVSAIADRQGVKDLGLVAQDTSVPRIRGTIAVDNNGRGPLNLQVQGGGNYAPVIPGTSGTQSLGVPSVEGQEAHGYTADGKKAKHLSHAEHEGTKSNPLTVPGQTGTNTHASSKNKALSLHTITMSFCSFLSSFHSYVCTTGKPVMISTHLHF